jgi:hypothetical protein
VTPKQYRWKSIKFPPADQKVTFIEGVITISGAGSPMMKVSSYFFKPLGLSFLL